MALCVINVIFIVLWSTCVITECEAVDNTMYLGRTSADQPIVFLSFANVKYYPALRRIQKEATRCNFFDHVECLTEKDLSEEFVSKHGSFLANNTKGYGFWIWKSYCIDYAFKKYPAGSIIVYADSGCSLNIQGLQRFRQYIELVRKHPSHRLVFEMSFYESEYTKQYTLKSLCFTSPEQMYSKQLVGGIFLIQNTQNNKVWLNEYSTHVQNYKLVDDENYDSVNSSVFVAHRHDQSVFSILNKKSIPAPLILIDETYFEQFEKYKEFPIHATRKNSDE